MRWILVLLLLLLVALSSCVVHRLDVAPVAVTGESPIVVTAPVGVGVGLGYINAKAKPAERRGRKATGPRFLREVTEDSPKDPRSPSCRIATDGQDCSQVLSEEATH